jgi:DNA-binding NarL/FixJ family response regulator
LSLQASLRRAFFRVTDPCKNQTRISQRKEALQVFPAARMLPPNQIAPVRVLLVDDFEPWRRAVCSMLKGQTELQIVGEVGDGLEAVQKAQELKPDLILLDIGLPNLNGLEAASRIRQVAPGAKILFLTQIRDKDMVRAALSAGAQGYVLKTDAGSELLPAVAGVLGGDDFVSGGIEVDEPSDTEET